MLNIVSPFIKLYKALYLFIYDVTGNYGISLVALSFVTFIILLPFNRKARQVQSKERKIQAVIAPQIKAIKQQYKGQEQYEKLKRLYHRYAYHPIYAVRTVIGILLQLPFLAAAYSMLSGLQEIQGVSWGIIPNLGVPDYLAGGINVLPFVMNLVTVAYAFVMPNLSKKERLHSIIIGFIFLVLLYAAPSALLIFWTSNLLWSLLFSVFEEKLQWIGDWIKENELAFHIIFTLALTVGLLIPLEIFIRNAYQLWFDLSDILKYFLLDTAKYLIILFLLYYVFRHKTCRCVFLSILLGLLFGVFLQSYIVGLDYGTFDGHEIDWDSYGWLGALNTFIWLFCLRETFIGFKRYRFNDCKIKQIVKPVTFCILAIQCVVLLLSLKNHPIQKNIILEDGKAGILTSKNLFTVSSNKNIIVFLIDAFDASIFEEIQKRNPEIIKELQDFTFYPDTVSSYSFTDFSLPELLTGRLYDPSIRFPSYVNKAWEDNPFYKVLREHDYSVYLYTSVNYVDKHMNIDNFVVEKVVMDDDVAEYYSELVKFRIAPHYLKRMYYQYHPGIKDPKVIESTVQPYDGSNDIGFYSDLKKGMKLTEKNAFKFYYLSGVHPPYAYDENMEPLADGVKGSAYKQALGSMKIVREFISQMKNHNIYDNATVVITADHGYHYKLGNRPIFLIKMPNDKNVQMRINDLPIKVSDMMPMICQSFEQIGKLNHLDFVNKSRYHYYEKLQDKGQFVKYMVLHPAGDIRSWVPVGDIKKTVYSDADREYLLGSKIDFSYYGNSFKYKLGGWQEREEWFGSITDKPEAEISLYIKDIPENKKHLEIQVISHPLLHFDEELKYRDLRLYANGTLLGSYRFIKNETERISFFLSTDIIKAGRLVLRFSVSSNKLGSSLHPDRTEDLDGQSIQINELIIK